MCLSVLETGCIKIGGGVPDWMPESSSSTTSETTEVVSTSEIGASESTTDFLTGGSDSASDGGGSTETDTGAPLCGNTILEGKRIAMMGMLTITMSAQFNASSPHVVMDIYKSEKNATMVIPIMLAMMRYQARLLILFLFLSRV